MLDPLTQREQEVLLAFAKAPDKQADIARELGISLRTVWVHLTSLRLKTGSRNQVQLLRWALREAIKIEMACRLIDEVKGDGHG